MEENGLPLSCEPRWRHLFFISEQILVAATKSEDIGCVLRELDLALGSIYEAFPKDLDPASDPEGFALRYFVKALLGAFESIEEKMPKGVGYGR